MLYLRTGANGSCKTLFTLEDVRKLQLETQRPVCVNARFKIKPEKLEEFGWRVIEFKDWQDQPDGTIFMIDECHNDLPLRSNSAPVPDAVRMLAEHRARGFDFYLLTQHPMNIDAFVRKLIGAPGWHQHLKRRFGATNSTTVLQWPAVRSDCEKDGSGKSAQVTVRKQPKEVYDWYESAELHTGKVQIPRQVYVLIACLVGVIALSIAAYFRLSATMNPPEKPPEAKTEQQAPSTQPTANQPAQGPQNQLVTTAELVTSYQPRLEGMPQTAPRYDGLTQPTVAPYPAACVHMKPRCQCYTQQGTKLDVPKDTCLQIVEKGFFMDWQAGPTNAAQPVNHSLAAPGQTQQVAAAAVPVAIGMQAGSKSTP
nr:zonular occludens toxin domain-containing protein [uncultured Rhodoferax sp.]